MLRAEPFVPSRFEASGELTLESGPLKYHTVSEDNVFYDVEGKAIASIFSYSYFRSDVSDEERKMRPVVFCYNGGPGASSVMVHAGFFGAKRVRYPDLDGLSSSAPLTVSDNPDCLLDIADVVLVDPIGTGYGILLDESHAADFYGIEEDANALVEFIRRWLTRYNRWMSPRYLAGESYGCTRSAAAAAIAQTGYGGLGTPFYFDGIINIGNTVTVGRYFNRDIPVESSVLAIPTCAAINWYHYRPTDQSLEEFAMEAKTFADTEYLLGLYQGENLKGEALQHFEERLAYYTGMSLEFLREHKYRFSNVDPAMEIGRRKGIDLAVMDGRIAIPKMEPYVRLTPNLNAGASPLQYYQMDDPASAKYSPFFTTAFLGEICPSLGITFGRTFATSYALNVLGAKWNFDTHDVSTAEYLTRAMHRNQNMRVFFINGWYDLCTQIGIIYYTVSHSAMPMDRVTVKGYPTGHMAYLGEDNSHEISKDLHSFLQGKAII